MKNVIELILSGSINSIVGIYLWSKISDNKINLKDIKIYIAVIIMGVATFFNYYYVNGLLRMVLVSMISSIVYLYLFKRDIKECIIVPILSTIVFVISELVTIIITYAVLSKNAETILKSNMGTLSLNLIINVIAIIMCKLTRVNIIFRLIKNKVKNLNNKIIATFMALMLLSINMLIIGSYYGKNLLFFQTVNFVLVAAYSCIIYKTIDEKSKFKKVSDKYNIATTSLNALEQVVSELKVSNHENKNQLLTIRSMCLKKDKKIITYLDKLIDHKIKEDEKLMIETSAISNGAVGSIVYSKILYMKESNINYKLIVDRKIKQTDFINLDEETTIDICKILGVIIDNAIEEIEKIDSKNIVIELSLENKNQLEISVSNNFEGEINLNKIVKAGFTTKGKGHGYGLTLVHEILEHNEKLSIAPEVNNNVFTQTLKVELE